MATTRASPRGPGQARGSTAGGRRSDVSPVLRRSPRHNPPPAPVPAPEVPISGPPPGEQPSEAPPEPSAAAKERAEREARRRILKSVQVDPGAAGEEGHEPWYSARRLLFNRTLHVYTIAPLHPPPAQGGEGTLGGHAFAALASELEQYLNLRLADADGLREQVGAVGETEGEGVGEEERPEPPVSRPGVPTTSEQTAQDVVSGVQMAWAGALGLSTPDVLPSQAWAVEIALSAPPDQPALKCHLVFLPSSLGAERAQVGSRTLLYPVLLASSPPAAGAVGKAAVDQTIAWLAAKFDTAVSSAGGVLASHESLLSDLAEAALRLAREELRSLSAHAGEVLPLDPGPVNVTYALPSAVGGTLAPPSPDLGTVSLTVPWAVGAALLPTDTTSAAPLLPPLEAYVRYHASLPLGAGTRLTTIGVGGVHVALAPRSLRVKWLDLPSLWAAEVVQRAPDRAGEVAWCATFAAHARAARVASVLQRLRTALEAHTM